WPLSEAGGNTAANVVPTSQDRDAAYLGDATFGLPGAIGGSADTSVSFDVGDLSALELPSDVVSTAGAWSMEMWFKVDPENPGGTLWSNQSEGLGVTPDEVGKMFVGDSGTLEFAYKTPGSLGGQTILGPQVNDGQWHHAIITRTPGVSNLKLYLDGVSRTRPNYLSYGRYAYMGNGKAGGDDQFTGQIDDVSYYRYPLTEEQADAHYAARNASHRLTSVTEPGGFVATEITYDQTTGRVLTLSDRHGDEWTLGEPSLEADELTVELHSASAGSITYVYDMEIGGRLISRQDSFGERTWEYNQAEFMS